MPSPVEQRRATPRYIQPQCPNGAPGTGNRALRATHRFTIENPLPLFGEALTKFAGLDGASVLVTGGATGMGSANCGEFCLPRQPCRFLGYNSKP